MVPGCGDHEDPGYDQDDRVKPPDGAKRASSPAVLLERLLYHSAVPVAFLAKALTRPPVLATSRFTCAKYDSTSDL
jgi:hypothetical protein